MTENAEGKDPTADERLEEIIREEKEDASTYYAQGESKDEGLSDSDYEKPTYGGRIKKGYIILLYCDK